MRCLCAKNSITIDTVKNSGFIFFLLPDSIFNLFLSRNTLKTLLYDHETNSPTKKKNLELVKEYKSNKKKPISTPIYLIK